MNRIPSGSWVSVADSAPFEPGDILLMAGERFRVLTVQPGRLYVSATDGINWGCLLVILAVVVFWALVIFAAMVLP